MVYLVNSLGTGQIDELFYVGPVNKCQVDRSSYVRSSQDDNVLKALDLIDLRQQRINNSYRV